MARRHQEKSLVAVLVTAPWQASIVVAVISFVAMRWLIPFILGAALVFSVLAVMAHQLAWLPLVFLLLSGSWRLPALCPSHRGRGAKTGVLHIDALSR